MYFNVFTSDPDELYINVFSYILNYRIIVEKIILIERLPNGKKIYRNANFLLNMSRPDFRVWIMHVKYNSMYRNLESKVSLLNANNDYTLNISCLVDKEVFCKVPAFPTL